MNSIQSLLKNQDFIAGTALNCSLDDKTALNCEKNIQQRIRRITGKSPRSTNKDPYKIEKLLRQFTPAEKEVTSSLIVLSRVFSRITTSAQTLAQQAGYCSKTVYRIFNKLTQLGLIKRKRRYNNSSITIVNPILEHPVLKSRLWTLFDAYTYFKRQAPRYVLLYLLFSANVPLEYSNRYKSTNQYHSRDDRESQSIPQPRSVTKIEPTLHQVAHIRDTTMASPISEILQKEVTPRLGLTRKGQLHLSVFDDGALLHGIDGLNAMGKGDRDFDFRLFVNLCEYYCAKHKIKVDIHKPERLIKQYGCRTESPMYYPSPKQDYQADLFTEPMKKELPKPPKEVPAEIYDHPIFGKEIAALASRLRIKT